MSTLGTLKKCGYDGEYFIVIDNLDEQQDRYKELYGHRVVVFDKEEWYHKTDSFDNFHKLKACVYVRNFLMEWARGKYDYILMLDDDITQISWRYILGTTLKYKYIVLDKTIEAFVEYMEQANLTGMGFKNGGIMNAEMYGKVKRSIQQAMLVKVSDEIQFCGRFYEDFNTSARYGNIGQLFFEPAIIKCDSEKQGTNTGGVEYEGRYIACFMSVMVAPYAVKIVEKKDNLTIRRVTNNLCPVIIKEKYKKW